MSAIIDGKPVVSRLLLQDGRPSPAMPRGSRPVYLAFSTRFDGKTVFTGVGVGAFEDGDLKITPIAQEVVNVLGAHCAGRLVVCECRDPATARRRAIDALKLAADGDGLFIVCKNSTVYDEVLITTTFGMEAS
jgi:hypothetical protein